MLEELLWLAAILIVWIIAMSACFVYIFLQQGEYWMSLAVIAVMTIVIQSMFTKFKKYIY